MPGGFPNAAGLESGSPEIGAAGAPARAAAPGHGFGTFTPDRPALGDWRVSRGIDTVALESPGVAWGPLYARLEPRGITPSLGNGRPVKLVPGRTSAWNAAPWLQPLHARGLLQGLCPPDGALCALRTLGRERAERIPYRAPPIRHWQKARTPMQLQLSVG